jgi:sn-glycerol 3-phosphate transport system permease protein
MTLRLAPSHSRWLPVAALLAPAFAFLAAFTYWPVLRVLGDSFMVGRFAGQHALGLDNYRRLFADPHFARAAWNNAAYAFGTLAPSLVLALLFALALRDTNRFTTVLRTFVVMPLMIPLVAARLCSASSCSPARASSIITWQSSGFPRSTGSATPIWRWGRS